MVALTLKERYELKKAAEIKNLDEGFSEKAKEIASSAAGGVIGAIGAAGAGVAAIAGMPFLAAGLGAGALSIMAYNKISKEDLKRSEAKWNESIKALEKLNQINVPDSLPALKTVISNFDQKIAGLLATERTAINKLLFGKGDDSDKSETWKTAWGLVKTDAGKMSDTVKQIEEFDTKLQKLYAQIAQVIKAYGGEGKADKTIKQILDRA